MSLAEIGVALRELVDHVESRNLPTTEPVRAESEDALRRILERLPGLHIPDLDTVAYPLNPIFRGPERLMVAWDTA